MTKRTTEVGENVNDTEQRERPLTGDGEDERESLPLVFEAENHYLGASFAEEYTPRIDSDFRQELVQEFDQELRELVVASRVDTVDCSNRANVNTRFEGHLVLVAPVRQQKPSYNYQRLTTVSYVEPNGDVFVGRIDSAGEDVGLVILNETLDDHTPEYKQIEYTTIQDHKYQRTMNEEKYTKTHAPLLRIGENDGDYFPVFGPEVPISCINALGTNEHAE